MANLRLFAERLIQSEDDAAADRYSTAGERGTHLEAVFGRDGHNNLQEKWSTPMPMSGCKPFKAFQGERGVDPLAVVGVLTAEERAAGAAAKVRKLLHTSLVVDKHVDDATAWLPKCLEELAPGSVAAGGSEQPLPEDESGVEQQDQGGSTRASKAAAARQT